MRRRPMPTVGRREHAQRAIGRHVRRPFAEDAKPLPLVARQVGEGVVRGAVPQFSHFDQFGWRIGFSRAEFGQTSEGRPQQQPAEQWRERMSQPASWIGWSADSFVRVWLPRDSRGQSCLRSEGWFMGHEVFHQDGAQMGAKSTFHAGSVGTPRKRFASSPKRSASSVTKGWMVPVRRRVVVSRRNCSSCSFT